MPSTMPSRARRALLPAALALAALSCEHPIAVLTPHVEAADLVVRDSAGAFVARTVENRRWDGASSLTAVDGASVRVVVDVLDFEDRPIPIADRADLEIRLEAEDPTLVQWEPQREFGRLHGHAVGRTRVRFLLWHVSHPDLVTPWIDLHVAPSP